MKDATNISGWTYRYNFMISSIMLTVISVCTQLCVLFPKSIWVSYPYATSQEGPKTQP